MPQWPWAASGKAPCCSKRRMRPKAGRPKTQSTISTTPLAAMVWVPGLCHSTKPMKRAIISTVGQPGRKQPANVWRCRFQRATGGADKNRIPRVAIQQSFIGAQIPQLWPRGAMRRPLIRHALLQTPQHHGWRLWIVKVAVPEQGYVSEKAVLVNAKMTNVQVYRSFLAIKIKAPARRVCWLLQAMPPSSSRWRRRVG